MSKIIDEFVSSFILKRLYEKAPVKSRAAGVSRRTKTLYILHTTHNQPVWSPAAALENIVTRVFLSAVWEELAALQVPSSIGVSLRVRTKVLGRSLQEEKKARVEVRIRGRTRTTIGA